MKELTISDKVRYFEFGTYTFKIIRQQTGVQTIENVFAYLSNKKNTGEVDSEGKSITEPIMSQLEHVDFICQFLFACAKHGALAMRQEVDFNDVNVSDWMDQIGYTAAMELVLQLIECYADNEKNHKAPVMGQPA